MKAIILAFTLCTATSSDLFTSGPIRTIRIEIAEAGIESLQSNPRRNVLATVVEGETRFEKVWLHQKKSNGGLWDGASFTVSFSRFDYAQRFHGLQKIHLNHKLKDPTYLLEHISGELFSSVGVPAARTTQARLILNGRQLGLFVLKEGFEEEFLSRWFKDTSGPVLEFDFNDREAPFASSYLKDHRFLMARVDTERFASMLAMEVLTGHSDGYSFNRNNYRVYSDANTNGSRWVFIVHGMNSMFHNFPIDAPYTLSGTASATTELVKIPEFRNRYEKRLREIFTNHFQLERLTNRVRELAAPIRAEIERVEGRDAADDHDGHVDQLVQRIANRWHEVDRQLKL